MKRNVDLTESRIFSTAQTPSLLASIVKDLGKHYLWDYEHMKIVQSDYDLTDYKSRLVLCGNASERQAQRFNYSLDSGDICECCGRPLTNKPWSRHYCLCESCESRLEYNCQKTWRFQPERLWQSSDLLTREMNRRE